MRLETMETAGINSSITTQIGAATTVGSGVIVIFGQSFTQVEIAFASMICGAAIGLAGFISSVFFKWLAHKEQCRVNEILLKNRK